MIKNSLKKLFIKISRLLGFEIIDQNSFVSPTLNKELNENLSEFNKKSIVLPLGEVKVNAIPISVELLRHTSSGGGLVAQDFVSFIVIKRQFTLDTRGNVTLSYS